MTSIVTVSKNTEKLQKVINFLKKQGKKGATYRELDLHLGGPTCNKTWLARNCGKHPDICADGSTSERRLYYKKGHGHEGFDNKFFNEHTSFVLPNYLRKALKEAAYEQRVTQSSIVINALRMHLKIDQK